LLKAAVQLLKFAAEHHPRKLAVIGVLAKRRRRPEGQPEHA
jgi:hypothetical protein